MSVVEQARRARDAAEALAVATRTVKDGALRAMAGALVARTPEILAANEADLAAGRAAGLTPAVLDRLALDPGRVSGIADALRQMAALPDPVGEVVRGSTLPNGLELRQVRVPFGVVGIIYEALAERHRGRGRDLPQVRQRGAAAWLLLRGALQRRPGRRAPRRGRRFRPAGGRGAAARLRLT